MRPQSVTDKGSFILHRRVQEALASSSFMKDGRILSGCAGPAVDCLRVSGGTLGFYGRYAYAHASYHHPERLSHALKGVDAIFYAMFHDLDLKVNVQAVLDDLEYEKECRIESGYNLDDISKDAELVAAGLHGLQLTEEGGNDGDDDAIDVCHSDRENNFQPELTMTYG